MTVQLVRAHRLYAGVPYAYASVAEPGALVFTAGACPLDENEMVIGAGDVRRQAQQVMANLTEALAAAGAALTDVLKTTVYVASGDRRDLLAAWDVVRAAFGEHDAPRRCLGFSHSAIATSSLRSRRWPSSAVLARSGDLPASRSA